LILGYHIEISKHRIPITKNFLFIPYRGDNLLLLPTARKKTDNEQLNKVCMCASLYYQTKPHAILICAQILGHLWGPLTTTHFQRCGVEPVTIGCFTPIGNKKPRSRQ
jgi:hypothetical protein